MTHRESPTLNFFFFFCLLLLHQPTRAKEREEPKGHCERPSSFVSIYSFLYHISAVKATQPPVHLWKIQQGEKASQLWLEGSSSAHPLAFFSSNSPQREARSAAGASASSPIQQRVDRVFFCSAAAI
jgi:hypothetical protein